MPDAHGFERRTLLSGRDPATVPRRELEAAFGRTLGEEPIAAVAVPGWSSRSALALLRWARERAIPAILMSESTAADAPRRALKELVKRRLLRHFAAALVGGAPQRRYLLELGFPGTRIFLGYDAVDNAHFARGTLAAARAGRPPFFLASCRFVPQKNLLGLLEAYARYRRLAGDAAWDLVILGDGALAPELEARRARLGLVASVHLPGFRQYDELPSWYGRASAFVLPSTSEPWGLVVNEAMASGLPVLVSRRCGCAVDLVAEGRNGFTFDPHDVVGLAILLHRLAHGGLDLAAMGAASRAIVARWGVERFAQGLAGALAAAAGAPPRRPDAIARGLLAGLVRP